MALQVWLPLNKEGQFQNQGLADIIVTNNGATYDANGKIGGCYKFTPGRNNASQYMYLNKTSADIIEQSGSFSLACWFIRTGNLYSNGCGLITCNQYKNFGFGLYLKSNGGFDFMMCDETSETEWQPTFYSEINKWTHVCVTYDKITHQQSLYINGEYKASNFMSFDWKHRLNQNIYIGLGLQGGWGYTLNGSMNDVRIYNHCLSPKEVHEIAKGLVLHYPMNDEYAESTINLGNNGSVRGWNNSGNSIRNGNDTSIPKILDSQPVYSIKVTTAGNCAITFSYVNASSFKGQTVTASCWFYTNSSVSASTPYLRSSINNNVITQLKYNGTTNPTTWPKNQWIRLTGTGTVDPNETSVYFCDYANNLNEFRAYTCWQLELKDHVTPYTPTTRNELVYDCSGYCNNGTVTGSLQVVDDSPRYNNSIKNISTVDNIIKAELNMSSMNQLTLNWWGKYNDGFRNGVSKGTTLLGGYINSSNDPNCANDYDTTAFNYRDGIWDMYNGFSHYRLNDSLNGITDNTWRMYTLVWNGSKAIQYVNGDQINSIAVSGTLVPFKYLYIGQSYAGGVNRVTTGCWSDIRLYSTALSDDDIKELYNTSAIINNNNTLEAYEFVE